MEAFRGIIWFLLMVVTIAVIFEVFRLRNHTEFFPKTKRRWHLVACFLALGFFALLILSHPFGYYQGILYE